MGIPMVETSHQQGHIAAALYAGAVLSLSAAGACPYIFSVQCRSCLRTALDAGEACSLEKALVGSAALLLRAD